MNNGIIKRIFVLLVFVLTGMTQGVKAQDVAVKSNVLADAFLNPNLGIEVGLAPKWTLDITGQFNAWTLSHERHWKHWAVQPEVRYWFCDRFSGHFVGAHIHGGQYNIGGFDGKINFLGTDARKLKDTRYQGWFVGAGIAYGYSYTRYDRFQCAGCGKKIETDKPHHYVGLTKAAINLVYVF